MKITIRWHKSLRLTDGNAQDMIYQCDSLSKIPKKAGLYVFGRIFAKSRIPIYVGQAGNLRKRVEQQFNNVKLMKGIENAPNGRRILMYAVLDLDRGQQEDKVLSIVESAIMKSAMSAGFELLNKQGTKTKIHQIISNGGKRKRDPFPRKMNVERK